LLYGYEGENPEKEMQAKQSQKLKDDRKAYATYNDNSQTKIRNMY